MALVSHQFLSPAKINLMLRILNQRPDGYHNLQTCFQLLNWGDEIDIKQLDCAGSNTIEILGFEGLKLEHNLIYKASQLLLPYAQNTSNWHIAVKKKIPMGAGLGGGSSNAAVVLRFLNEYWQCGLHLKELIQLGAKIGADVPIFLLNQSAIAGGVGDRLQGMVFNTPYILLMFPECSISTSDLFAHKDLQRAQVELSMKSIKDKDFWINDFFPTVLKTNEMVLDVFHQLKDKIDVRLSGTGSTLFALFETQRKAEQSYEFSKNICQSVITTPFSQ